MLNCRVFRIYQSRTKNIAIERLLFIQNVHKENIVLK